MSFHLKDREMIFSGEDSCLEKPSEIDSYVYHVVPTSPPYFITTQDRRELDWMLSITSLNARKVLRGRTIPVRNFSDLSLSFIMSQDETSKRVSSHRDRLQAVRTISFFPSASDTWPGTPLGFIKDVGKVHAERGNTFSVLVCIFADKVSWDCRMRSSKNVSNVWRIRNRTRSKTRIPLLDYPSALCGGDISSMYRIKNLME